MADQDTRPVEGGREDPMWDAWMRKAPEIYNKIYYKTNPIVARVNLSGHHLVEAGLGPSTHFGQVLEVGAGTGIHLDYVRHRHDRYLVTDLNAELLAQAESRHSHRQGVEFQVADATRLPFGDNSFDRLVSIYNLEHLPEPHRVLREWHRVVKPGGLISIAIPTEGGIAWNLGRHLTTRRSFAREGLDLDYIIAREHINACYRLVALIRHAFPERRETWYPLRVPLSDINLVVAVNAIVPAKP